MTPKPPVPVSEWDTLADSIEMPNTLAATVAKVDVLTTIPESIRKRAETSLAINTLRVTAKTASAAGRPRVDYQWDCQPVASSEQGAKFAELLVKYAKYRPYDGEVPFAAEHSPKGQVTARPQGTAWYTLTANGKPIAATKNSPNVFMGVRYSVRPFEQRKDTSRLPGTV